jgi:hypothetical protein
MQTELTRAIGAVALLVTAILILPSFMSTGTEAAQHEGGMCNGRTDPDLVVIAHANGRPGEVPKYILNVTTDELGQPSGALVFGRGSERLLVDDFCRLWQHQEGQPPGGGGECGDEEIPEGATIVHAVGTSILSDGSPVLVRTDARATEEGMFFRLRYRAQGAHHEVEAGGEDGCEDDTWARFPAEGWYPLDQLRVHAADED